MMSKKFFSPEFINRLDEIVVFKPLPKEIIVKIVDKMIGEINKDLSQNNIVIVISEKVKEFLAEKGFDFKMGARPLRKTIRKYIEDVVSQKIVEEKMDISNISKGNKILKINCYDVENDSIKIKLKISNLPKNKEKKTPSKKPKQNIKIFTDITHN